MRAAPALVAAAVAFASAGAAPAVGRGALASTARGEASAPSAGHAAAAAEPLALPVAFIENRGQWAPAVRFAAATGDGALFVTDDGLTLVRRGEAPGVTHLRFDDADPRAAVVPGARLPGVAHFLRGNDPRGWVTGVPTYAGVTLRGLRPGVDLRLDGSGGRVGLALSMAPGADVGAELDGIRWRLTEPGGRSTAGRGTPDRIDAAAPRLVYSTFLGGRFSDLIRGLAVDGEGFAYVAGTTTSLDYPTAAPLQPGLGNSGSLQDAFVAKLDPTGTQLVYSTFLGGNRQDEAFALAIDRIGRVHVTGYTQSPDFPTRNPVQPEIHLADGIFSGDTFIAKLTPDGGGLEFSTFFGGTARDVGKGIAVDAEGFVYTTGWTGSNFPAFNAIYPLNRGVRDAFVVKLAPAGDRVVYSTHLGGSYADDAKRIAVDGAGNAYIVGTTTSLNLRVVAPFQRVIAGASDAFVAKLNADGTAFGYATYLGGRGDESGIDIAVNAAGEAYVLGQTDSPNFPRQQPLQATRGGATDLFVTRFTAAGDALVFSTYLGGNGSEGDCVQAENFRDLATPTPDARGTRYLEGSKFTDGPVGGIALDAAGRVHVASCTSSGNLALANPLQTRRVGGFDLLLSVLAPAGDGLAFGTYLGGRPLNVARALAVGRDGGIYVAGQTDATDFPLAPAANPLQRARSGTDDAFVLKIGDALDEAPTTTPPGPTDTPDATDTPAPTETAPPEATATPTDGVTPSPSRTPTATAVPSGTATSAVEPTATARATATATMTSTATATAGSATAVSPTVATPTPAPTSTAVGRVVWLPWVSRE